MARHLPIHATEDCLKPCVYKTGDNLTRGKKQGNDNPRQGRTLEAVACTRQLGEEFPVWDSLFHVS
jgi:hypothetical protein